MSSFKAPASILKHPGVLNVVAGSEQGSDCKYWVFLRDDWGYYEHGQREPYYWISHGFGVDSVKEFNSVKLERK